MDGDNIEAIVPSLVVAIGLVGALMIAASARRFERRQKRKGLWDENGPIHPTTPPPGWLMPKEWAPIPPTIETDVEEDEHEEAEFEATVFFSSVLRYATKSANMTPAEAAEWANKFHQQVTDAVLAEGGEPVKYIGDGFLAYFDGEDTRRRALRAAVAARDSVADQLVTGLATGSILRTDIGHSEHSRPDIVGSVVNAAFRVNDWAAKSTEGRIAILGEDARELDSEFELREHDYVELKGLPESVTLFEVMGARA